MAYSLEDVQHRGIEVVTEFRFLHLNNDDAVVCSQGLSRLWHNADCEWLWRIWY